MSEVETAKPPRKRRKGCLIALGVFAVLFIGAVAFYGPTLLDFWRTFGDALFKPEKQKYSASNEENLKALYQGLKLHHESEGMYPDSSKWMDGILNRLKSNNLARGEAEKKLVRPDLAGQATHFGYAMNDAVSEKYSGDIADPKTILIYESEQTQWNAHGDPKTDRTGMAITIDGTVLKQ